MQWTDGWTDGRRTESSCKWLDLFWQNQVLRHAVVVSNKIFGPEIYLYPQYLPHITHAAALFQPLPLLLLAAVSVHSQYYSRIKITGQAKRDSYCMLIV